MNFLIFALLSCVVFIQANEWNSEPCASPDWHPFSDDKCFTLIQVNEINGTSLTFQQATSLCKSLDPEASLPTIGSAEEQSHIADMVLSYGSIWIGAELKNGALHWQDEAHHSNFSNWSEYLRMPKRGNFCVLMDDGSHGNGNWTFHSCRKSFMVPVVCQRHQVWGLTKMRQVLHEHTNAIERTLQRHNLQLLQDAGKIEESEQEVSTLRGEIESQVNITKSLNEQLESLQTNSTQQLIPIGFIYIQYKGQSDPSTIWPYFSWSEISSNYAGQFFRAVGGNAASFGTTQNENFPKITSVQYQDLSNHPTSISISYPGTSSAILSGQYGGDQVGLAFTASGGENRPYNSAMRIWKRTG